MNWDDHFDFFPEPYESIRFKGQRFPIEIVLESYVDGWAAEKLADYFSYALTPDQIAVVIRYYDEQRDTVSAYLARGREVAEWHRQFWTTRSPSEAKEQIMEWNALYGEQAKREGVPVIDVIRRYEPEPALAKVAS